MPGGLLGVVCYSYFELLIDDRVQLISHKSQGEGESSESRGKALPASWREGGACWLGPVQAGLTLAFLCYRSETLLISQPPSPSLCAMRGFHVLALGLLCVALAAAEEPIVLKNSLGMEAHILRTGAALRLSHRHCRRRRRSAACSPTLFAAHHLLFFRFITRRGLLAVATGA